MTVKEAIDLLANGTDYVAIGAKSGRRLFDNWNSEETRAKYYDIEVPQQPFFCTLAASKNKYAYGFDYCKPVVGIWVSGK